MSGSDPRVCIIGQSAYEDLATVDPQWLEDGLEEESLLTHLQDVETMDDYYYDFWTPSLARKAGYDLIAR